MSKQEPEVVGRGRFETSGWRSIAAGVGLFAAGLVVGATFFGDIGETPCYEVEEMAQPARNVMSATFGGGEEGRRATRTLLELAREHRSCFHPPEVELFEGQLQSSPGEVETVEPTVMPSVSVAPSG